MCEMGGVRRCRRDGIAVTYAEERDRARKALALLEGPVSGWCLACLAVLRALFVYGLSHISLGAATFCVILTILTLVEGMRRTQLAIREAQRDLDEWERLSWRSDKTLAEQALNIGANVSHLQA